LAGKTFTVLNIETLKLVGNRNSEIQFKKEHFLWEQIWTSNFSR